MAASNILDLQDSSSGSNPKRSKKQQLYYGWIILVVSLIMITVSYGIRFSFGVFFKSLEQDFGLSRAMTSGIFSIYMILGSFFALIGGWLADRYGVKIMFTVLGFFAFLGLALTSLATELWHLLLSYSLLVAIGTGPIYPVVISIATRWFQKRRGLALAIVTCGIGLGSILMVPFAAYLITSYGWRFSFVIIGVIVLVITIPCSLFFKKAPSALPEGNIQGTTDNISSYPYQNEKGGFSFKRAFKIRNLWLIFTIWFLYSLCSFIVITHLVPHAIDLGVATMQAATILSIIGFATIPSRILIGMASDKFGRKPLAFFSALIMAAAMVWLIYSSSLWMFYVFAIVIGVAFGGITPSITAMVGDIFGVRNIGAIMGVLEVSWVLGAAAGPALAGYVFDTTGTYFLAFLVGVIAAFMVAALIQLIRLPAARNIAPIIGKEPS